MKKQRVNLIQGDKVGGETDYRDALAVNMFAISRAMGKAEGYMLQCPGLTEYGQGKGPDRGGVYNSRLSNHFRLSGSQFVVVNEDGTTTRYGNIDGKEPAAMPYSFNTQAVIADKKMFLFDFDNGFRQIADPDLGEPIDGIFIDGYYFMTDGEFLFHTDAADESSISPNKFATSEFSPDPTKGVGRTADNKAIAFNRYTIEFFANRATENFAFKRLPGACLKIGIVATHAKAEVNNSWYIVGGGKNSAVSVYRVGGGGQQQVASREVDKLLAQYTEAQLENIVVEVREENANTFIIVHLPNETLLFNETIAKKVGTKQAWSILKSGTGSKVWRGIHGVFEPRLGKLGLRR